MTACGNKQDIEIVLKDGRPQKIIVGNVEIPNVTSFSYDASGNLDVKLTLCGNVKFVEEARQPLTINITAPTEIDTNVFQEELLKAMKQGASCSAKGAY